MGGCPLGEHGWGTVDHDALVRAVHVAVDSGITMFDTADIYGLGSSERTLGQALGKHRKDVVIASKFGVRIKDKKTYYDNSGEWINKAVDASLQRLNTDYIDLYQLHYRDRKTPINEVVESLQELQKNGKIRYFGLSNITADDILELLPFQEQFVSFQDEYSLATRKNETTIRGVQHVLSLTPMTWGSLGQGILTGKYSKETCFDKNDRRSRDIYVNFHGNKLLHNLDIVEILKDIAISVEKSVPAIAIRFILDYIENSVVLTGIKSEQQLMSNMEAMGFILTLEQIKRLLEISKFELNE
jgi:aryl-alcohol dehydrogenase-like predicted oxidoreductase